MTINEIKFHELDGIGINNIIFLVAELLKDRFVLYKQRFIWYPIGREYSA